MKDDDAEKDDDNDDGDDEEKLPLIKRTEGMRMKGMEKRREEGRERMRHPNRLCMLFAYYIYSYLLLVGII